MMNIIMLVLVLFEDDDATCIWGMHPRCDTNNYTCTYKEHHRSTQHDIKPTHKQPKATLV